MALDINRDLIEREWVLPRLRTLVQVAKKYDGSKPISFATEAIGTFHIQRAKSGSAFRNSLTLTNDKHFRFPLVLQRLYSKPFEGVFETIRGHDFINDDDVVTRLNESKRVGKKGVRSARDKNIEGALNLKASDDQWISNTDIGVHFERFRVAILAVAEEVEKSVRDAESSGRNLVLLNWRYCGTIDGAAARAKKGRYSQR
jgi:hypothetical protein